MSLFTTTPEIETLDVEEIRNLSDEDLSAAICASLKVLLDAPSGLDGMLELMDVELVTEFRDALWSVEGLDAESRVSDPSPYEDEDDHILQEVSCLMINCASSRGSLLDAVLGAGSEAAHEMIMVIEDWMTRYQHEEAPETQCEA